MDKSNGRGDGVGSGFRVGGAAVGEGTLVLSSAETAVGLSVGAGGSVGGVMGLVTAVMGGREGTAVGESVA